MTDNESDIDRRTVTFRYETDTDIPSSETFEVDPQELESPDSEMSVYDILETALEIIYSAPAFDWVDDEIFDTLDLVDIEGLDIVKHNGYGLYFAESEHGVVVRTVMSGAIHEFVFEKHPDGDGVYCEQLFQDTESYSLYPSDVPELIKEPLEERYGEIIE